MSFSRRLPVNTHVWTFIVVKVDDSREDGLALGPGGDIHLVDPFPLQDAVHTLGNSIFERITTLGHTYAYATVGKDFHIGMTTVLATPVGMMDKATGIQSGYG